MTNSNQNAMIEKEKEGLETQEVEEKYKAEPTAELREEYSNSKMVLWIIPCILLLLVILILDSLPSRQNHWHANDLANSAKKVVQQKGTLMVLAQIPSPRKKLPVQQNLRLL